MWDFARVLRRDRVDGEFGKRQGQKAGFGIDLGILIIIYGGTVNTGKGWFQKNAGRGGNEKTVAGRRLKSTPCKTHARRRKAFCRDVVFE